MHVFTCVHMHVCMHTHAGSFQTRTQAYCRQGSSVHRGLMVEKRIDTGEKAHLPAVPGKEGI